ncbi:MAG: DUF4268 domain-containing protein [Candidatus Thorarchaeota archaeon]
MDIGKLENIPIRDVWDNEPRGFNKWLADNIDILSEALNLQIPLVPPDTESSVGPFLADLVIENESGERVVIECQLEDSDHKHLGQVVTYLTNLEAKMAIWICTNPRSEHIRAISWLNEVSPVDISFFIVRVQTVKIGDSPPAPLFTLIAGPSEATKETGRAKELDAERHRLRQQFWSQLLEKCQTPGNLFKDISPGKFTYIQKGAGFAGITYKYVISYSSAGVELYIDTHDADNNKRILDRLKEKKDEIENRFGIPLIWDHEKGRRACKVSWKREDIGLRDEDDWPNIQDELIQNMAKLHMAINDKLDAVMKE